MTKQIDCGTRNLCRIDDQHENRNEPHAYEHEPHAFGLLGHFGY